VPRFLASVDVYDKGISPGSMSKAYSPKKDLYKATEEDIQSIE